MTTEDQRVVADWLLDQLPKRRRQRDRPSTAVLRAIARVIRYIPPQRVPDDDPEEEGP